MNIISNQVRAGARHLLSAIFAILFLAILAFFILGAPPSKAGPIPWLAGQYPVFYVVSNGGFTVASNAANTESNFFQSTIPGMALGNNGAGKVELFVSSPDAAAVGHTWKVYLGGTGTANPPAGSTCISTNTLNTDSGDVITVRFFGQNSPTNIYVTGYTSTNGPGGGYIGSQKVTKVLGTTTNLLLTVTGAAAQATNVMALDGIIVSILQMP